MMMEPIIHFVLLVNILVKAVLLGPNVCFVMHLNLGSLSRHQDCVLALKATMTQVRLSNYVNRALTHAKLALSQIFTAHHAKRPISVLLMLQQTVVHAINTTMMI